MRMAEQPAGGRIEAEPAHGEHARQMAVRDDGDIAVCQQRPNPVQHHVRTRGHLLELLARMVCVAGNDPVRHKSQPGLIAWICAAVRPS